MVQLMRRQLGFSFTQRHVIAPVGLEDDGFLFSPAGRDPIQADLANVVDRRCSGERSITANTSSPNAATSLPAKCGPMPLAGPLQQTRG